MCYGLGAFSQVEVEIRGGISEAPRIDAGGPFGGAGGVGLEKGSSACVGCAIPGLGLVYGDLEAENQESEGYLPRLSLRYILKKVRRGKSPLQPREPTT